MERTRKFVIWSEEHGGWWRPKRNGYTRKLVEAGWYSQQEAEAIVEDANGHLPVGTFHEVMFDWVEYDE